jgi:glucose-6-phosphate 1-dehydrogenase
MAVESDALVFFGATGDLAYKQVFPALLSLVRRGEFDLSYHRRWQIGLGPEQLVARAHDSVAEQGPVDEAVLRSLAALLRYVDGDYADPRTFTQLRQALGQAERPLHYLAIPPSLFPVVAQGLAESGCANNARIVVEKPFGRDLASARDLNRTLHQHFPEPSIYRIDHYLGKEPVQNLLYFRFANTFWSRSGTGNTLPMCR